MKDNFNMMFYYISFVPMLIISLAVLCSLMPVSAVIQKCCNRRIDVDSHNDEVSVNAMLWTEVRNADRYSIGVSDLADQVKYDAEVVSENGSLIIR